MKLALSLTLALLALAAWPLSPASATRARAGAAPGTGATTCSIVDDVADPAPRWQCPAGTHDCGDYCERNGHLCM